MGFLEKKFIKDSVQSFIGRENEISIFQNTLKLFSKKSKEKHPYIFLIYGANGLGKTELIKYFKSLCDNISEITSILIDSRELINHDKEICNLEAIKMMLTIRESMIHSGVSEEVFEEFNMKYEKYLNYEKEVRKALILNEQSNFPTELFQEVALASLGEQAAFQNLQSAILPSMLGIIDMIQRRPKTYEEVGSMILKQEEFEVYSNAKEILGKTFAKAIDNAASLKRLVLLFDNYEEFASSDNWMRDTVLQNIDENEILIALSGSNTPSYEYKKRYGDYVLYWPVRKFESHETKMFLEKKGLALEDEMIKDIQNLTEGIPFALNLFVDISREFEHNRDKLGDFIKDDQGLKGTIVEKVTENFLGKIDPEDRVVIFALSVIRRVDIELLKYISDNENAAIKFGEIRQKFSFISLDGVSELVKKYILDYLFRFDLNLFKELNRKAYNFYKNLLENGNLTSEKRKLLIKEILYYLSSIDNDTEYKTLYCYIAEYIDTDIEFCEEMLNTFRNTDSRIVTSIKNGILAIRNKKYSNALPLLNTLQKEYKSSLTPGIYTLLGLVYFKKRDIKLAIKYFQNAIHLSAHYQNAYVGLGRAYFISGDYENAMKTLEYAVSIDPNNIYAQYCLAGTYYFVYTLKDFSTIKPREVIESIKLIEPNESTAYLLSGLCNIFEKQYVNAMEEFSRGIEINPKDTFLYFIPVLCSLRDDSYLTDADRMLKKAEESFPDDPYIPSLKSLIWIKKGLLENAVEECKNTINIDDKNTLAYLILGFIYVLQKNYNEAIREFKKVTEINLFDFWGYMAHLLIGFTYLINKKYSEAIRFCKNTINKFSYEEPEILSCFFYMLIAEADFAKKRYQTAKSNYKKVLNFFPNNIVPYIGLARTYLKEDSFDKGIEICKKALTLRSVPALKGIVQLLLGNFYLKKERYEDALKSYNDALENIPLDNVENSLALSQKTRNKSGWMNVPAFQEASRRQYASIYNSISGVLLHMERYDEALKSCRKAIKIDKNFAESYATLGMLYFVQEDFKKAIKHIKKALEIDKDCVPALLIEAQFFIEEKKFEDAHLSLTKVLNLDSNNIPALLQLSIVEVQKQKYSLAIRHLKKVIQYMPSNPEPYKLLGSAYFMSGEIDESINNYNAAIKLDSSDDETFYMLAELLYYRNYDKKSKDKKDKEDYSRAKENYQKAIHLNPENSNAHNMLGFIYACEENFESAIYELELATKYGYDFEEHCLSNLGYIYLSLNQYDRAEECCNRAIEVFNHENRRDNKEKFLIKIKFFHDRFEKLYDESLYPHLPMDILYANYCNLGTIHASRSEFDLALESYDEAIELSPSISTGYIGKAYVYLELEQFSDSHKMFKTALRLDKENEGLKDEINRVEKLLNKEAKLQDKIEKKDEHVHETSAELKLQPPSEVKEKTDKSPKTPTEISEEYTIYFKITKQNNNIFFSNISIKGRIPFNDSIQAPIKGVDDEKFKYFKQSLRNVLETVSTAEYFDPIQHRSTQLDEILHQKDQETIIKIGQLLMELIIPTEIRNEIERYLFDNLDSGYIPVMIVENEISDLNVPWELIYHVLKEDTPVKDFFWGERFIISEIKNEAEISNKKERVIESKDLKFALVLNQSYQYVNEEKTFFEFIPEIKSGNDVIVDSFEYKSKLKNNKYNIIHIAAHGEIEDDTAFIDLGRGGKLDHQDIKMTSFKGNHPIVFLNICDSKPSINYLGLRIGLADSFIDREHGVGAKTCVCTNWKIPDKFALRFVERFYTAFFTGYSIGYSLFNARNKTRDEDKNPMWLAYTIRGNPFVRLETVYAPFMQRMMTTKKFQKPIPFQIKKPQKSDLGISYLIEKFETKTKMVFELYDNQQVAGYINRIMNYELRIDVETSESTDLSRFTVKKLNIKFIYESDAQKLINEAKKIDQQVQDLKIEPIEEIKKRYEVPEKFLMEGNNIKVTMNEGEIFKGEIEWASKYEIKLKLLTGASVVLFKHAINKLEPLEIYSNPK